MLDWEGATSGEVFGLNLYFVYMLLFDFEINLLVEIGVGIGGSYHRPPHDYESLKEVFWRRFALMAGDVDEDVIERIKIAGVVGLLLSWGFSTADAGAAAGSVASDDDDEQMLDGSDVLPRPISEETEEGKFGLRMLDAFILDPVMRIMDFPSVGAGSGDHQAVPSGAVAAGVEDAATADVAHDSGVDLSVGDMLDSQDSSSSWEYVLSSSG